MQDVHAEFGREVMDLFAQGKLTPAKLKDMVRAIDYTGIDRDEERRVGDEFRRVLFLMRSRDKQSWFTLYKWLNEFDFRPLRTREWFSDGSGI